MGATTERIIESLVGGQRADGSWGYGESTGAAEPTAIAALALAAHQANTQRRVRALRWLADQAKPDGAVPAVPQVPESSWPTALCVLAWASAIGLDQTYNDVLARSCNWLLDHGGAASRNVPRLFGHDTTLVGWSWVPGTHSWIEPTSYAVLALRVCGYGTHPRVRQGQALLQNRAIDTGGWNYGNTRVIDNMLRPFPATTGIALAALSHLPFDDPLKRSCGYLRGELRRITAATSVGWASIGLRLCGAASRAEAEAIVARAFESSTALSSLELGILALSLGDLSVIAGSDHS